MAALERSHAARGCLVLALCALTATCSERSLVIFEDASANGGNLSTGGGGGETGGTPSTGGSGIGGTSASGGEGGAAGAPNTPGVVTIDDFEDSDTRAIEPAGWWYMVNDRTSEQSLRIEPDPLDLSPSLHTTGQGFTGWGAALGVDLANVPIDAGLLVLRFEARAEASREVSLHFIDKSDARFTHTLTITATWQEHTVRLDQLYTAVGEEYVQLDPTQLDELHWFFFGGDAFDVWLDDVAFAPM